MICGVRRQGEGACGVGDGVAGESEAEAAAAEAEAAARRPRLLPGTTMTVSGATTVPGRG